MKVRSPLPKKRARIEIIPLIDIMFFLLASFMMVSLSQVHMKGIKVQLPTGVSGDTQNKREYISLSVDKDGYFYFDKEQLDFDKVLPKLQAIYAISPDAKVFVRGDRDALHGNVIRLLNQIRSSGYNRIAFEIKSEAGKGIPQPPSLVK